MTNDRPNKTYVIDDLEARVREVLFECQLTGKSGALEIVPVALLSLEASQTLRISEKRVSVALRRDQLLDLANQILQEFSEQE